MLNRYLFTYKNFIHVMTGFSFCTMVHKIRTRFDLVAKGSSKDCILKKKIENYPGREEDFRRKTTEEEYLEEAY